MIYAEGYPKTKYPQTSGGSITVTSPEQEKSLGPGWVDHPPPELTPESEPKPRRKKEQPSLESI
jgi:hypothetical protein